MRRNRPPAPVTVTGDGGFNFVRTSTMFATVYVSDDDDHPEADRICMKDCDYTVVDGRLDEEAAEELRMPDDRRFWLLTVLSGHFGDRDGMLEIQERLAGLYRLAFSR